MTFIVREHPPPLMRPQPPEVWSHLVAFVRARLAERHAHPDVLWRALDRSAALVADCDDPHATVDAEEAMWHLASIWRDHPAFRALLEREYDRWYFTWHLKEPRPDRDKWIREWTP